MIRQSSLPLPTTLHQRLAIESEEWRKRDYECPEFPLISALLKWQWERSPGEGGLRYLRHPQLQALETYWYIRLVKGTPHVLDLYREYYKTTREFANAMGIPLSRDAIEFTDIQGLVDRIRSDPDFVKSKKLDTLRELITLGYPSYILALAMGAGKTVLIGTIVATEFCMGMRYPDRGRVRFMRNALVFAPGTTIIESLREISDMPFGRVLPPTEHTSFISNVKVEFPRLQSRGLKAKRDSLYNLIVTNTEKIRLRLEKKRQDSLIEDNRLKEANLRLDDIASLPNLGVFSDEAHHTYGNTADNIKRVRETVDFVHGRSPLVAVVNTTGTPYYRRQELKEVVVWYGLKEGIQDNILKSLTDGVRQYNMKEDSGKTVISDIIGDFFKSYGDVRLPGGEQAKIAFYFKNINHLEEAKGMIALAMTEIGESPEQILVNTQESTEREVEEFRGLNSPESGIRVVLLVQKGVEGWNCPSLFACALIKEQTSSTFVLQASTRCLRQIPSNPLPARIYLDVANAKALDKELQENFRTDLGRLTDYEQAREVVTLRIVKVALPKLEVTRFSKRLVPEDQSEAEVVLRLPSAEEIADPGVVTWRNFTPVFDQGPEALTESGDDTTLPPMNNDIDCVTAAWRIASNYRLPYLRTLAKIRRLYPDTFVPKPHFSALVQQVEKQTRTYKIVEEEIREALALIRVQDSEGKPVFEMEDGQYVHKIRYSKAIHDRMSGAGLLAGTEDVKDKHDVSYHYVPYNFDSVPERSFFESVLRKLNTDPGEVEAFLFTGGLAETKRTDFFFEYQGTDGNYHNYFPDFVIVKKSGEFLIVELKAENSREDETVKRKAKAVERLTAIESNKFKYHIVYSASGRVAPGEMRDVAKWLKEEGG